MPDILTATVAVVASHTWCLKTVCFVKRGCIFIVTREESTCVWTQQHDTRTHWLRHASVRRVNKCASISFSIMTYPFVPAHTCADACTHTCTQHFWLADGVGPPAVLTVLLCLECICIWCGERVRKWNRTPGHTKGVKVTGLNVFCTNYIMLIVVKVWLRVYKWFI